jgi:hypothetical protein
LLLSFVICHLLFCLLKARVDHQGKTGEKRVRMVILSAVLYFFTQHPMLAMLALLIAGLSAGALLAELRGHRGWYSLIIPFYLFSQINFFTGHVLNALFLNAFGTTGSAVIVHSRETNS